MMHGIEDLNSL